jgi:hypothetical protein
MRGHGHGRRRPLMATPAAANSAAADYFMSRIGRSAVPKLLSEDDRAWYKDLFAAIKRQDWARRRPCSPPIPMARCTAPRALNITSPPVRRALILIADGLAGGQPHPAAG